MYTIMGLGNPGDEYKGTRHNAGREIIISLSERAGSNPFKADSKSKSLISTCEIEEEKVRLVLPETFMNKSGHSAAYFIKSPKAAEKLIVVHDDLDLPLGTIRFSVNRGSGGHKGVESIARAIKTKNFIRLRVGISKLSRGKTEKPHGEAAVQDYVLGGFSKKELEVWKEVKIRGTDALISAIGDGVEKAMGEYNK